PHRSTATPTRPLHAALPIFPDEAPNDAPRPTRSRIGVTGARNEGAAGGSSDSFGCRSSFSSVAAPVTTSIDQRSPAWVAISSELDRKSTRLNSSHVKISYAV